LSRLAGALEALLSAGVTIIEAWELAATACGSPSIRRTVMAWRPLVDGGQTPAEVVALRPDFPSLFANQYTSGEISGKLDDTLKAFAPVLSGRRNSQTALPGAMGATGGLLDGGLWDWLLRHPLLPEYFNMVRNAGGF